MIPDTPECFASHLGLWAMHPPTLREALAQVQSGTLKTSAPQAVAEEGYEVAPGQIALISLRLFPKPVPSLLVQINW